MTLERQCLCRGYSSTFFVIFCSDMIIFHSLPSLLPTRHLRLTSREVLRSRFMFTLDRSLRVAASLMATTVIAESFAFTPSSVRCAGKVRHGTLWAGGAIVPRSRLVPRMLVTDVGEVVGTETEDEQTPPAVTIPSRFERIKESYKGATSALDLSGETAAYADFDALLDEQKVSFTRGEIVKGTVVQFEPAGALIDIGAKSTAFMPTREASLQDVDDIEHFLELDEEREVMIISEENDMGQVQVSTRRIEYEKAWEKVKEMQANDAVFKGPIVATNRGGAIILVEGLRAFLPGSHMSGGLPSEEMVGTIMPFKFLEVNPEASKLVVSNRRAVLEQEMKELSRGDVVEGHVKAIKPYGAFVEIRGISGLLHISQISFDRIEDLPSILHMGMALKCMIIDHDKVNGRIALSTKTLEPEPGDMIKNPQKVYDMAEATAAKYHQRMEHERKAREDAAKSIVMGLGDGLDSFDSDVLAGIADGIESVLRAPAPAADSEEDKNNKD